MLTKKILDIDVLNYEIIEGTSKKNGKPYKCIKIQGTTAHDGKTSGTFRGSLDAIELFENFTEDFNIFYSKDKPVTHIKVEGIFQNFQFNLLKILEVTF